MAFRVSRSRVYGDGKTAWAHFASVRLAPARHVFRCDSAMSNQGRWGEDLSAKAAGCRSRPTATIFKIDLQRPQWSRWFLVVGYGCTLHELLHERPYPRSSSSLKLPNAPPEVPPKSKSVSDLMISQTPRVLSRGTEILLCGYRSAPPAVVGGFPSSTALVLRQAWASRDRPLSSPVGFVKWLVRLIRVLMVLFRACPTGREGDPSHSAHPPALRSLGCWSWAHSHWTALAKTRPPSAHG